MTRRAVLERMSVSLMKWWAPEGQSLTSPLSLPPLPPAPTPHAPYLAQHFGHFRHLVNVCWTEKLYNFVVVAVFISLMPLLLCIICFHRWISPSPPMRWLGTGSCDLVQFGPKLGIRKWFHERSYLALSWRVRRMRRTEDLGPAPKHVQVIILKADIPHNCSSESSGIFSRPVSLWD